MPLRSLSSGAVTPVAAVNVNEKKKKRQSSKLWHKQETRSRRRPFLLSIRSSDNFIFATAAIGLFTSTFVHSILFPLSPFIINRINHGGNSTALDQPVSSSTSDVETSRETGILVALYAVGLLVGSPIFGWLGDKIRQRRIPMLLGISSSIAANLMFMFAITYWMLLLARFLQGVSNACVWTMSLCLIADNWPEDQLGFQMGKLMGFYPLGIMTGLPVGVLYSKLGHQAPFIASMSLCGIDFFMRLVIVERCHSPKEWFLKGPQDVEQQQATETSAEQHNDTTSRRSSSDSTTAERSPPNNKVTLWQLLRRPRLLVSLHLTMILAAVLSSFEATLSMHLAKEWGFDETACSLILIAYMLPSIASSAFSGWLCDKYGPKIVVMVSLVLVTPVCIAIGIPNHETSFWPLAVMLAMGGATMAGCQSPVFPEIASVVAHENRSTSERAGLATSYALFNAAYGTGMCFGPILAGFLYGSVGFFWLCFALAMMFVVIFPFAYIYVGDRRSSLFKHHRPKKETCPEKGSSSSTISCSNNNAQSL